MSTTFDWLSSVLVKDYSLDQASLVPTASLETLGLDSLALAELLFCVEDTFKITVPPEPITLTTLDDVTQFIDDQVAAQRINVGTPEAPYPASGQ